MVIQWSKLWLNHFEHNDNGKYVYSLKMDIENDDYFRNSDNIEVCIKGLLAAIDAMGEEIYFAITNAPSGFIKKFMVISGTLAGRRFPDGIQLYICETDIKNAVVIAGNTFANVLQNAYILSIEDGWNIISKKEVEYAKILADKFGINTDNKSKIKIFPFDSVLNIIVNGEKLSIYEHRIKKISMQPLDSPDVGYNIQNTHMRLGSRVHIESFYEMSFLFYRTSVANRFAFIVLRHLKKKLDNQFISGNILFYGYGSYSKPILTSCTEILNIYRNELGLYIDNVASVAYQHNLLLESEEIQMYYSVSEKFPGTVENNKLEVNDNIIIVQIVPISSTLSTYDKMWDRLINSVVTDKAINLCANYTFFWVANNAAHQYNNLITPSAIEKKYWQIANLDKRTVKMKFSALDKAKQSRVHYFIRQTTSWHDPVICSLCYPKNVLDEYPLVETDPTSTVPEQQIRSRKKNEMYVMDNYQDVRENNRRIKKLVDCVYYGHIRRRLNHYQYYFDTQKYFYIVKDDVRRWLHNLKDKKKYDQLFTLNIIFSPEHNTNAGFCQFVNTYYFDGLAEIVSLNVDKVFRSNFICEHSALINLIENLCMNIGPDEDIPVKFYFVDDTIITGETLSKAVSLMTSLIPVNLRKKLPEKVISKVFLLIDRLSNDSQKRYVNDYQCDFISFVHIDISNMRTQGDSCIGCKLEREARRMFKRSSTKILADYWSKKAVDYRVLPYDGEEIKKSDKQKAYNRMVISHILQNCIIKNNKIKELGDIYDGVSQLLSGLVNNKYYDVYKEYKDLLESLVPGEAIKSVFKIISRPFFNYDFRFRLEMSSLLIIIAELELEKDGIEALISSIHRKTFLNHTRVEKTKQLWEDIKELYNWNDSQKLEFFQKYIIESLIDINSTYLLQKVTINKIYRYLIKLNISKSEEKQAFWDMYAVGIFRLCANHFDGSRELRIQIMLFTGSEYNVEREPLSFKPSLLFNAITHGSQIDNDNILFYYFCQDLFMQSSGIYYDGIKNISDQNIYASRELIDSYNMDYWKKLRCLEEFTFSNKEILDEMISAEKELRNFLKSPRRDEADQLSVKHWYKDLLKKISDVICQRFDISSNKIFAAILTENNTVNDVSITINNLEIVSVYPEANNITNISGKYYSIKNKIIDSKNNKEGYDLDTRGYYISNTVDDKYIVLIMENPNEDIGIIEQRNIIKTQRVYFFFDFEEFCGSNSIFKLMIIARLVMTYRNSILKFVEQDFVSDILARYAHTLGQNNILSHEKAKSHNTTADDVISIEKFLNKKEDFEEPYKRLTYDDVSDWLLLRNYTNGQIAKLFNRSFHDDEISIIEETDTPLFYIPEDNMGKNPYMQKLIKFADLSLEGEGRYDGRFLMLKKIVRFSYDQNVENSMFVCHNKYYYNLEYFKCILVDIIFSALKYQTWPNDFLCRVDRHLDIQKKLSYADRYESIKESLNDQQCIIHFCVEEIDGNDSVNYLTIQNPVNGIAHNILNCDMNNKVIRQRLEDPLDYADGHMSLVTIKRYIEGLFQDSDVKCVFEYVMKDQDVDGSKKLYFQTKLPVIMKEERKE